MSASKKSKKASATRKVLPTDFVIDPRVQRTPPSNKSVQDIIDRFDPNALGVLEASQRDDGTLVLLDGQRRVSALLTMGMEGHRVTCTVNYGMTLAEEAKRFRDLNNQRNPTTLDDFLVGITEGDQTISAIVTICREHGWEVGRHQTASATNSAPGLLIAWNRDGTGDALRATLAALNRTFGRERETTSGNLLRGMSLFISEHGDVNLDRLVTNMRKKYARPCDLLRSSKGYAHTMKVTTERGVACTIARAYGGTKSLRKMQ